MVSKLKRMYGDYFNYIKEYMGYHNSCLIELDKKIIKEEYGNKIEFYYTILSYNHIYLDPSTLYSKLGNPIYNASTNYIDLYYLRPKFHIESIPYEFDKSHYEKIGFKYIYRIKITLTLKRFKDNAFYKYDQVWNDFSFFIKDWVTNYKKKYTFFKAHGIKFENFLDLQSIKLKKFEERENKYKIKQYQKNMEQLVEEFGDLY